MLNGHEPAATRSKVPLALDSAPSPQADGTPKSSRTAALRNRLGFRRNDGSPKNTSRAVSGQNQARDRVVSNRNAGGFLLDSPRSKIPTPTNEGDGRQYTRNVSSGFGGYTGGKRVAAEEHEARAYSDVPGQHGGESSRASTSLLGASTLVGDAASDHPTSSTMLPGPSRPNNNPAEIVGLALSLSDNRRRRSNMGQLGTAPGAAGARMLARDIDFTQPEPPVASEEIVAPVANQPHKERDGYAERQGTGHASETGIRPHFGRTLSAQRGQAYGLLPISDASSAPPARFVPSQATLKRVEKTKAALELAYHHRRVLQHLQELPRLKPALQRPSQMNGGPRGRAYNPLQYIRNRRVRQREGCPLNPAKDGWEDVDRVRAWVDSVAQETSRNPGATAPTKSLPPLMPTSQDLQSSYVSFASNHLDISRAPRLRADWSASPAEMLADAHWIHDSDNRFMMVDRDGNKLYQETGKAPSTNDRIGSLGNQPAGRGRTDRLSADIERPRTRGSSMQEDAGPDRGRKRDQQTGLKLGEAQPSSSTDRKYKRRRNILRSNSPSVRSDGSGAFSQPITRGMHSMDEKDLQDVLLLRQQLRLLSQDSANTGQQEAPSDGEDNAVRGDQKYFDAASQYSTDEGDSFGRSNFAERNRRSKTVPLSDAYAYDSGMSSEQESGQPSRRIPNLPDIFVDAESSAKPRPRLMESALPAHPSSLGNELRSRDSSLDDVNYRNNTSPEKQPLHAAGRIDSDTNLSPSRSPLRHFGARRKAPQFSNGGSPRSSRDRDESDSRIRGLIRGSKLTELVSAPAAKVSDLLWRKNDSEHRLRHASTASLESEEMPNPPAAREDGDTGVRDPMTVDSDSSLPGSRNRGYNIQNLPVFRSPFKGNSATAYEDSSDHISRQQQALRHRRSQSRFEQLAPLSLDLRSVSGSPSRPVTPNNKARESSSEYQQPAGNERRSAVDGGNLGDYLKTRSENQVQDVGEVRLDRWKPDSYTYAIARPDIVAKSGKVTKRDVARLDTLMTSCAVQSNELVSWVDGGQTRKAAKADEAEASDCLKRATGVGISRSLLASIGQNFTATREAVGVFSEDTVNELHQQLQDLHNELSEDLTGAVRKAERAADELGSQLALDCTLEVKRLNETVDIVMRRRRRRTRWLRRTGFSLLEWAVLAAMWWVWLLVVLFRLANGTVKGIYWTTRWLLWL